MKNATMSFRSDHSTLYSIKWYVMPSRDTIRAPVTTGLKQAGIEGKKTSQEKFPSTCVAKIQRHAGCPIAWTNIWAPPMTKTFSIDSCRAIYSSTLLSPENDKTPLGRLKSLLLVKTTFKRFGKGRNFSGKDSHVLRPITTALHLLGVLVPTVISLKCFKSSRRCHASAPCLPIPQASSIATIIEKVFIV